MTGFQLKAGATIDLLTQDELDTSLDKLAERVSERGRGIKPVRFFGQPQSAISTTAGYTIPYCPNEGYVWSLRSISCTLSTAANALFNIGSDTHTGVPSVNTLAPLGGSSPSALVTGIGFGKGQMFLYPDDYIVVSASASATLNSYRFIAIEVPSELVWKVC